MSTPAVSASAHQQLETFFHTRLSDLGKLNRALQSGDLATAQQAYNAIVALGEDGPFHGNAFRVPQREQDFAAVGLALQNGDLAAAQQAFSNLRNTFIIPGTVNVITPPAATPEVAGTPAAPSTGGLSVRG